MIEVLKQALEALENSQRFVEASANAKMLHGWGEQLDTAEEAITSLRQAIAELESQEPVSHQKWCASLTQLLLSMPPQPAPCNCQPPQRTWQGLTDEEIKTICLDNGWDSSWQSLRFAHAIEAKLKERNL